MLSDDQKELCQTLQRAVAAPLSEYRLDYGPVVWWRQETDGAFSEFAWIGVPDDDDWPGYHTHWTPHPELPAPPGA